jgi:hypothetical protein
MLPQDASGRVKSSTYESGGLVTLSSKHDSRNQRVIGMDSSSPLRRNLLLALVSAENCLVAPFS